MSKAMKDNEKFAEAAHLQTMEDNPLDAADRAMFAMFEREGWSSDKRRAYILQQTKPLIPAAE